MKELKNEDETVDGMDEMEDEDMKGVREGVWNGRGWEGVLLPIIVSLNQFDVCV